VPPKPPRPKWIKSTQPLRDTTAAVWLDDARKVVEAKRSREIAHATERRAVKPEDLQSGPKDAAAKLDDDFDPEEWDELARF
jgi:hypothetical protein